MPKWHVDFTFDAVRNLQSLPKIVRMRISLKIDWMIQNFDSISPLGMTGEFVGFYKIRVGDYRILYDVDWQNRQLTIFEIGHRSKVYKKK